MEILLAIVVTSAVIFFGALISMGNERQKNAIDNLREQAVFWMQQDIRIKREQLTKSIKIDDPARWINRISSLVLRKSLNLAISEIFHDPQAVHCIGDGNVQVIFSTESPTNIRKLFRSRKAKISSLHNRHPLFSIPRTAKWIKISLLNGGIMFDLELQSVWENIYGESTNHTELWMCLISGFDN